MSRTSMTIQSDRDPYRDTVQCLVNQPPTVVRLLVDACRRLNRASKMPSQADVYDRLVASAPRVAIICGSADHVAHISDNETVARVALAVWDRGGVPFCFGVPVMCDGTAQSHLGMCYSLFSRNLSAEHVASQMESHAYHAAIVLQGCDKTPFGVACGLAAVDRTRIRRGDPALWATFVPVHVMKGGKLPTATRAELESLAQQARNAGLADLECDLRATMKYVVQCTTNEAYGGIFRRLVSAGVLSEARSRSLRRQLATCACDAEGGICAFNGTGNSSRLAMAALGLAHPAVELLTKPPSVGHIERVVKDLFRLFNRPECGVSALVRQNWANAVRVHSATGGSTNLVLHLVAVANYAGLETTVETYDKVHRKAPVPDIFDFSLTEKRSHHELAKQCQQGRSRGMETIFYELMRQKVPLNLDALTVTGTTWTARLGPKKGLPATGVRSNPIVLTRPRRPVSGVDILSGNFFSSAVVKVSGLTDDQLDEFDDKLHVVMYLNNEDEANEVLLSPDIIDRFFRKAKLTKASLLTLLSYNAPELAQKEEICSAPARRLYETMTISGALKIAAVIAGQGPKAFGMPEMFVPMHHINNNRRLRKITTLISDGRYSGVSYGAAIGHVTPEAMEEGGIVYLQHGDILRLRLRDRTLDLMDSSALARGTVKKLARFRTPERKALAERRIKRILRRRTLIATLCLQDVTDASTGVVPRAVLADSG